MNNLIPVSDIKVMADAFAKSGLFAGVKTPEQAMALMLWCQAEGMHPAIAARDFHIIQGRPALKADAMLARFQAAGGRVEWKSYTDAEVVGVFSHSAGGSVEVSWDVARAKNANLTSDAWKKYPRAMMRARCISEGIRTVFPGVLVGFYNEEEIKDMPVDEKKAFDNAKPVMAVVEDAQSRFTTKARELYSEIKNGVIDKQAGAEAWYLLHSSASADGLNVTQQMYDNFNGLLEE